MGLIKLLRHGSWWVTSASDPRWNGSGRSDHVGMFATPGEATAHVERKRQELGEPPDDLEWGYMKD